MTRGSSVLESSIYYEFICKRLCGRVVPRDLDALSKTTKTIEISQVKLVPKPKVQLTSCRFQVRN